MNEILKKVVDKIFNEYKSIFTTEGHKRAGASEKRRYRHDYYKRVWSKDWHLVEVVRVR